MNRRTAVGRASSAASPPKLGGLPTDKATRRRVLSATLHNQPSNSSGWIDGQVAALTWKRLQMKPGFGP